MEINDQTDVVFITNCGRALTLAHTKFQQIVNKVVESASKIVPRFNKHCVQPYIKTIRERLEKEMENGNKPRFLTKCNDNESLFEITDDEAINNKIFERMKRKKITL